MKWPGWWCFSLRKRTNSCFSTAFLNFGVLREGFRVRPDLPIRASSRMLWENMGRLQNRRSMFYIRAKSSIRSCCRQLDASIKIGECPSSRAASEGTEQRRVL
ncbi:unnamed protein product [Victoria cruziana]